MIFGNKNSRLSFLFLVEIESFSGWSRKIQMKKWHFLFVICEYMWDVFENEFFQNVLGAVSMLLKKVSLSQQKGISWHLISWNYIFPNPLSSTSHYCPKTQKIPQMSFGMPKGSKQAQSWFDS